MSLKIRIIDGINPFEWEDFKCPLCQTNQFVSVAHAGVYCDECNARFCVRDTAGDPGCVVDCYVTEAQGGHVYAPAYECQSCKQAEKYGSQKFGRFAHLQDILCPVNANHGEMTRVKSISMSWRPIDGVDRFCLVLKKGDYCSGWGWCGTLALARSMRKMSFPTQNQWDAFQARTFA
jgi:hypothetical protein